MGCLSRKELEYGQDAASWRTIIIVLRFDRNSWNALHSASILGITARIANAWAAGLQSLDGMRRMFETLELILR